MSRESVNKIEEFRLPRSKSWKNLLYFAISIGSDASLGSSVQLDSVSSEHRQEFFNKSPVTRFNFQKAADCKGDYQKAIGVQLT